LFCPEPVEMYNPPLLDTPKRSVADA